MIANKELATDILHAVDETSMLYAQGLTVSTLLASLRTMRGLLLCERVNQEKIKSDGPHFIPGKVERFRMYLYRTIIEEKSYSVNYK